MTSSATAVVLGGTDDHRALLAGLTSRGFTTVLVDPSPAPRAKPLADVHVRANALDADRVEMIARECAADAVVSLCVDQALAVACLVSERLGTTAPMNSEQALDVTNKARMKERLLQAGIPTAPYSVHRLAPGSTSVGARYPLMVKPVDANGSQGVRRIERAGDLAEAFAFAFERSREGQVVLEEYAPGIEVSIDCFVREGQATVLHIGQLQRRVVDPSTLLICRWASHAAISEMAQARIRSIAGQIAEAFHLTTTPLLIQAIVDADSVTVIEFSPRVGGGSKSQVLRHVAGVDIIEHALSAYLGEDTSPVVAHTDRRYIQGFVHSLPGTFARVTGLERLISAGVLTNYFAYVDAGAQVDAVLASRSRVGSFLVAAANSPEAEARTQDAVEALEVLDSEGRRCMRKDLLRGPDWV